LQHNGRRTDARAFGLEGICISPILLKQLIKFSTIFHDKANWAVNKVRLEFELWYYKNILRRIKVITEEGAFTEFIG